jgi:mRNA-degrading endonuclease RelE of RelBE toxin-antitoxin system
VKYHIRTEHPSFIRCVKKLKRKFPLIEDDLFPVLDAVSENPRIGTSMRGFGEKIYKIRVPLKSHGIGKSAGLRLLYVWDNHADVIVPIMLYHKANVETVTKGDIEDALRCITE